jgi:hypothetical protein
VPYGSKLYHCSICGAVMPNEPKPVLQHQMSHVRRRPYEDLPKRGLFLAKPYNGTQLVRAVWPLVV